MEKRIMKHLPGEILDEILYKLPVKSLLRFKCVSKPWRSSISSTSFIRDHLKKSNSGTNFAHHNLLFQFQSPTRVSVGSDFLPITRFINPRSVGSCCIGSLLNDINDDYEPNPHSFGPNQSIPIPAAEDNCPIYFLGSCNGLILISMNLKELYLWNPSIRKAKNILNASFPKETRSAYDTGCGLGYNELTDDYKVVSIFYRGSGREDEMLMYSSRTDSWKKIQNFEHGSLLQWPAKFVNGKLHWLTKERMEDFPVATIPWNIVSLDLVEEKYQIIAPPPPYYLDYHDFSTSLAEFGGYLSFICYNQINRRRRQNTMDVWVMKKESWSKIWTLSDPHCFSLTPIWLKKNGGVMVTSRRTGSHLVVYRKKRKLCQCQVDNMIYQSTLQSIVYVESLVAPISDEKQLCQ